MELLWNYRIPQQFHTMLFHSNKNNRSVFRTFTTAFVQIVILSIFAIDVMAAEVNTDFNSIIEPLDTTATSGFYHRGDFRVGLVLSGGGAKGIAHAGVIKALEENDIPIDCIAGTSMGSVVGSLYACGFSPEEMMTLFTSKGFADWSTGVINRNMTYYFSTPEPTPKWLAINLDFKDSTNNFTSQIIPTNLISPLPMNLEFLKLYSPYTKQCLGDFNNLFVPLRTVCSDVYHKRKVVCHSGSLGDAVRASMSFPLVFKPIELDGILVYDGGIYDNFPINVMQEDFDPDFIIGVSVSGPDGEPEAGNIYSQLEDMIIQNNNYDVPEKAGVKIQVPVLNFGVLEFDKARTIYEIGYKTGLSMVDSIKNRCKARVPQEEVERSRMEFKQRTPVVEFDSVAVEGATPEQSKYLVNLFQGGLHPKKKYFGMEQVTDAYYRAVTNGKLYDLLPQAEFGKNNKNTLLLKANVKKPWNFGVGGWITSSAQSMLYFTFGYHTLSLNSLDVDASAWIGQSYYAGMLSGKIILPTSTPSSVRLMAVWNHHKYYESELMFFNAGTPAFISSYEGFLRGEYTMACGRQSIAKAELTVGLMSDEYYPYNEILPGIDKKDKTKYRVSTLRLGYETNTLDNQLYPMSGKEFEAGITGILEGAKLRPGDPVESNWPPRDYKSHWGARISARWKNFYNLHKNFNLGVAASGVITIEPLYQDYTATLIHAPAFEPTPSTKNYFNPAFRGNNWLAAGVMPIWNPVGNLQLRGDFYAFCNMRELQPTPEIASYKGWFRKPQFLGEVAAVYNFPFASLSIYCNYLSSPVRNWNFGLSFGLYFQAPKLMR